MLDRPYSSSKKKYKSDIRNNLFYIDNFFKIKKDEKLAKSEISHCRKNTLCLLYKALYNLNDKVDLLAAERELTELLGDENIDVSIRIIAAESYFHGCMLSTRYFNELPKFNLKSERIQILSEICAIKKGQISYNESKFKDVMNQSRIDFELLKYKKLLSQHEVIFFPFNEIFLKFSSSLRTKQIDLDDLRTDAIAIENNHFLCDGDFSIFLMLEEQEKITTMKIDSIFNNLNSISTVGLVQLNQIIDKTYVSSHYSSEFDIDRLGIQTREYLRKKWLKVKSSVKSK